MNSVIIQGIALTSPELRSTPDNSNTIASFLCEFPAPKAEDPPFKIKVTAWNKTGDRVMEKVTQGMAVIVEGRLRLDTVDRGTYKEKRTELVASDVHVASRPAPMGEAAFTDYVKTPVAAIAPTTGNTQPNYEEIPF